MLDDFSRYILAWKLCTTMTPTDVSETLAMALRRSGLERVRVHHRPRLLSDDGPSYLSAQLELIRPKVVVSLGNFATKLLLDTDQGITRVRGRSYPMGAYQLVPTYHPAAALRSGGVVVAEMRADLVRAKQLVGSAP